MPFPVWLSELRRLLDQSHPADVEDGGWTDTTARSYYDEGHSPASAMEELRFRELACS